MLGKRSVIAITDDDSGDRILIEETLRDAGFDGQIRTAGDGSELIDSLSNGDPRPNLILLDLNMPLKDGRETLKELRSNPEWRSIPIVIHSTCSSEEDVAFCYAHGANSYVVKPSSYEKLRENMKELVGYWFRLAALPSTNSY